MQITFLSDTSSWKNPYISNLARELRHRGHRVVHTHDEKKRPGAATSFFIFGFFQELFTTRLCAAITSASSFMKARFPKDAAGLLVIGW